MPAFGRSLRDRQMLEFTQADDGAGLALFVLHEDAKREYACDPARGLPPSRIDVFPRATCDQATKQDWTVISRKDGWKRLFAFDNSLQGA
jgi:predicted lipoprotein with Yx(FWY)xxD motif